jgi:IS30 family transposase
VPTVSDRAAGAKGTIITLTEHKTGFLLMEKLVHRKQALSLAKVIVRHLFSYKNTVHTITANYGSKFTTHEYISKTEH